MKNVMFIFVGILLSLLILEILLQSIGFGLTMLQNYKNKKAMDSRSTTILCIGESTTHNQWPPILQKILDEKAPHKKFKVVDEGHIGANSAVLASKIQQYIIKYNPDIVITMIGVNDLGLKYKKSKIKILNLFSLLQNHIKMRFFFDYTDEMLGYIEYQALEDMNNRQFVAAEKKYLRLWDLSDRSSIGVYFRLLELYFDTRQYNKFEAILKENNATMNSTVLSVVFQYLLKNKKYSKEQLYEYVKNHQDEIIYDESMALLLYQYGLQDLIENIKQKKVEYVETLISKRIENDKFELSSLIANYNYILNEIYKHNTKTIVMSMQYPMLSLGALQESLKDSQYYDKIVFIDNEENFKKALKTHKTREIFIDMFSGNFGHCTEYGNTLIAENVAKTIVSLYDKEKL